MKAGFVLHITVPVPVYGTFDYLLPESYDVTKILPGIRARVPFGRRSLIGIIVGTSDQSTVERSKLKPVTQIIDLEPIIADDILALLQWASSYYCHPIGEVISSALPALIRRGDPARPKPITRWRSLSKDQDEIALKLKNAPKQAHILRQIQKHPSGCTADELNSSTTNWRPAVTSLLDKELIESYEQTPEHGAMYEKEESHPLNTEQNDVLSAICSDDGLFSNDVHLIYGITGSGKTEIYLHLSESLIRNGKQVLIMVPEISLTPQLTRRFEKHLGIAVTTIHSGLSDNERLNAWHRASTGNAKVVLGTRSSIFTPMPELALIVIDEEHDGSYKQNDSFRYNARDLAVMRAKQRGIPVVLGSATPSFESLQNAYKKRYLLHRLTERANETQPTRIDLIDMCSQPLVDGISKKLFELVERHLNGGGQVLLFLNRRGYSPLLMCHDCGWTTHCSRCDAHMTYHKKTDILRCHHCGSETRPPDQCTDCGSGDLIAIGLGTERIENILSERFPDTVINRIDRDTTRTKDSLQKKIDEIHKGEPAILIGTQMLAKGHDFPNVSLVAVLDTDQALYSADFRATEHLAQLIIQVAGRSGRADKKGEVIIQTHHPDHPLLQQLIHKGYDDFARMALAEREAANLPPYSYFAILRCEATRRETGVVFMRQAKSKAETLGSNCIFFGPLPAPMERRAGRFRTQIIAQSNTRSDLQKTVAQWIRYLNDAPDSRKVRWSIDIDPYDTY